MRWLCALAVALAIALGAAGCPTKEPPPVVPAPPLPADPEIQLDTMEAECALYVDALTAWKTCPNLDTGEDQVIQAWIDRSTEDMTLSKKVELEPNAKKATAGACRKAAESVRAAHERCRNGKRPRVR
jgi:hypothetical protein